MVRHLNHKDLKNIYFDSLHFILRQVITHAKFLLEATTGGNLYKKNVLGNFAKFTHKTLVPESLF